MRASRGCVLKGVGLAVFVLCTQGCASLHVVKDARGVKPVSTITMSCKKPYAFVQDCSELSGAKKALRLDGLSLNIAGSEDGKRILLMGAKPVLSALRHKNTVTNNHGYEAVKRILHENGMKIIRAMPVATMGTVYGYVIEVDREAYSFLSRYGDKS